MSDEPCGFCEVHDCWHGSPGEEARGERHVVVRYLRELAKGRRQRGRALEADAGTQARSEANFHYQVAIEMERASVEIEQGRHWR